MRLAAVILFIVLMLACTPVTQADQSVSPPRPQLNMVEIHYKGTVNEYEQIRYFDHDGIRCYIHRTYSNYERSSTGGPSCVRK